jgi:hypothetical protein
MVVTVSGDVRRTDRWRKRRRLAIASAREWTSIGDDDDLARGMGRRAGGASSCRVKKKKNLNQKSASRAHALVPVRVASLCPAATSACARASHVMYY